MKTSAEQLIFEMMKFDAGDPARIQHYIKVYTFAHMIGLKEHLDEETLYILDSAAVLHDIGIHPAEEKYGKCNGKLQELEGPPCAREMLEKAGGFTDAEIDRICFLIAHHHTYDQVDGMDYRILLEADFLVNAFEDHLSKESISAGRSNIFETESGNELLNIMFGL